MLLYCNSKVSKIPLIYKMLMSIENGSQLNMNDSNDSSILIKIVQPLYNPLSYDAKAIDIVSIARVLYAMKRNVNLPTDLEMLTLGYLAHKIVNKKYPLSEAIRDTQKYSGESNPLDVMDEWIKENNRYILSRDINLDEGDNNILLEEYIEKIIPHSKFPYLTEINANQTILPMYLTYKNWMKFDIGLNFKEAVNYWKKYKENDSLCDEKRIWKDIPIYVEKLISNLENIKDRINKYNDVNIENIDELNKASYITLDVDTVGILEQHAQNLDTENREKLLKITKLYKDINREVLAIYNQKVFNVNTELKNGKVNINDMTISEYRAQNKLINELKEKFAMYTQELEKISQTELQSTDQTIPPERITTLLKKIKEEYQLHSTTGTKYYEVDEAPMKKDYIELHNEYVGKMKGLKDSMPQFDKSTEISNMHKKITQFQNIYQNVNSKISELNKEIGNDKELDSNYQRPISQRIDEYIKAAIKLIDKVESMKFNDTPFDHFEPNIYNKWRKGFKEINDIHDIKDTIKTFEEQINVILLATESQVVNAAKAIYPTLKDLQKKYRTGEHTNIYNLYESWVKSKFLYRIYRDREYEKKYKTSLKAYNDIKQTIEGIASTMKALENSQSYNQTLENFEQNNEKYEQISQDINELAESAQETAKTVETSVGKIKSLIKDTILDTTHFEQIVQYMQQCIDIRDMDSISHEYLDEIEEYCNQYYSFNDFYNYTLKNIMQNIRDYRISHVLGCKFQKNEQGCQEISWDINNNTIIMKCKYKDGTIIQNIFECINAKYINGIAPNITIEVSGKDEKVEIKDSQLKLYIHKLIYEGNKEEYEKEGYGGQSTVLQLIKNIYNYKDTNNDFDHQYNDDFDTQYHEYEKIFSETKYTPNDFKNYIFKKIIYDLTSYDSIRQSEAEIALDAIGDKAEPIDVSNSKNAILIGGLALMTAAAAYIVSRSSDDEPEEQTQHKVENDEKELLLNEQLL